MSASPTFRAAKPWGWVIWVVQTYLQLMLCWRNRLHLEKRDLEVLRNLPPGSGIILAHNHADETDFKVCLVLSRRCGRRFLCRRSHPESRCTLNTPGCESSVFVDFFDQSGHAH
jgi:hypothetical protein